MTQLNLCKGNLKNNIDRKNNDTFVRKLTDIYRVTVVGIES